MSQSIKLNDDLYWDVSSLKGVFPSSGGNISGHVRVFHTDGAAGANNNTYLQLGNNIDKSQAGNSRGVLQIFGNTTYYTNIYHGSGNPTANRTLYLPDASGTILTSGNVIIQRAMGIGTDGQSIANNTIVNKGSIEIENGAYIIIITVVWQSNSTGYRQIAWSDTSGGSGINAASTGVVQAVSTGDTRQQLVVVDTNTSSTPLTRYINIRQNSGSSITCTARIAYLKLAI